MGRNIRLNAVYIVGEVNQSRNMDGELSKNGANDVDVENIGLGAFLRQAFDRLWVR